MSTTRTVLRQRVSESLNDYWASTATGAGTTTTLVDTVLKQLAENNDDLAQYYIYFTSGTAANIGKTRRALLSGGFTFSTGTLTWASALGSATASADGYELHRVSPDLKNNAINRAAEMLSRFVSLPIRDETLIVDNLLSNSDMETFSAGFTGWTEVGSPTVTQESTIIRHGSYSAKMVSSGSAVGRMYQALTLNVNSASNKTLYFKAWVYASVASLTRIGISFDGGSTYTYSSYHSGGADWELLDVSASIPSTATSVRVYLLTGSTSTAATAYFDACRAWVNPVYRYTCPASITKGIPTRILQQVDEYDDSPTADYAPLGRNFWPIAGRRLRIEGHGTLTRPGSETATMEVSNEMVNVIVEGALRYMHRALGANPGSSSRDANLQESNLWARDMQELIGEYGIHTPMRAVYTHEGTWDISPDGETSYIQLKQWRG